MTIDLETLSLIRLPTANGMLFLYPEYRELAPQFDVTKVKAKLPGGTRGCFLTSSLDGSNLFVAKPERQPDNTDYQKAKKRLPKDGNLTFREISIARALSRLAEYEDDVIVQFERPFGYYQDRDGKRTGLFEYKPGLTHRPEDLGLPQELVDMIKETKQGRIKTEARIQKELDEIAWQPWKIFGITLKLPRKKRDIEADNDRLYSESLKEDVKTSCLESMMKEIYFPNYFVELVLVTNGVWNNEGNDSFSYFKDENTGKIKTFARDFELCLPLQEDGVEGSADYYLAMMSNPSYPHLEFHAATFQKRLEMLDELNRFSPVVARRVEKYLAPTGYFEGHMERKGPAFGIILGIRKLTLDQVLQ